MLLFWDCIITERVFIAFVKANFWIKRIFSLDHRLNSTSDVKGNIVLPRYAKYTIFRSNLLNYSKSNLEFYGQSKVNKIDYGTFIFFNIHYLLNIFFFEHNLLRTSFLSYITFFEQKF